MTRDGEKPVMKEMPDPVMLQNFNSLLLQAAGIDQSTRDRLSQNLPPIPPLPPLSPLSPLSSIQLAQLANVQNPSLVPQRFPDINYNATITAAVMGYYSSLAPIPVPSTSSYTPSSRSPSNSSPSSVNDLLYQQEMYERICQITKDDHVRALLIRHYLHQNFLHYHYSLADIHLSDQMQILESSCHF